MYHISIVYKKLQIVSALDDHRFPILDLLSNVLNTLENNCSIKNIEIEKDYLINGPLNLVILVLERWGEDDRRSTICEQCDKSISTLLLIVSNNNDKYSNYTRYLALKCLYIFYNIGSQKLIQIFDQFCKVKQ